MKTLTTARPCFFSNLVPTRSLVTSALSFFATIATTQVIATVGVAAGAPAHAVQHSNNNTSSRPPSAAAATNGSVANRAQTCSADSVGANLIVTPGGFGQLISLGVDQALTILRADAETLVFPEFTMGPQHNKADALKFCGDEAYAASSIKDFYTHCWGLPQILFQPVDLKAKALARPIPTQFKISNLKVKKVDVGTPQAQCEGTQCAIRAQVKNLTLTFDLNARDLLTDKSLIGLKHLRVEFQPALVKAVTPIEIKASAERDAQGWLKIDASSVKIGKIPAGAFRVGYDVDDKELEVLNDKWVGQTYQILKTKLGLKAESVPARQLIAIQTAQTSHAEIASAALDESFKKIFYGRFFDDEISATISSLLLQATQPEVQTELLDKFGLFSMLDMLINRVTPGLVLPLLGRQTSQITGIGKDAVFPTQTIRIQDVIDLPKIKARLALVQQFVAYLKVTDARTHASDVSKYYNGIKLHWKVLRMIMEQGAFEQTRILADQVLSGAQQISQQASRNGWSDQMRQDLQSEISLLQSTADNVTRNSRLASFDVLARAQGPLLMRDNRLDFRVSTCFGNESVQPSRSLQELHTGSQDPFTVAISLEAINRLIMREYRSGGSTFLNVCINKDGQDTCADQALFAATNEFTLTAAPALKIDESSGELYIEVNKLIRKGSFLGSDILGHLPFVGDKSYEGRIYLAFNADNHGNVKVSVARLTGGLTIDTRNPLSFLTSVIESVTFGLQDRIINSLGMNITSTQDVSLNRYVDFQYKHFSAQQDLILISGEVKAIHLGAK